MTQRQTFAGVPVPRSQRGFGIISALLALVIGSIVAAGQIQGRQAESQVRAGAMQGDIMNLIKTAANDYAMENYPALQSNLPVTKNGVTLAAGNANGEAMSPRVQDLVAMGYLSAGTSDQARLGGGVYQIRLRREPVGCVTVACNIPGTLFADGPVIVPGTAEMNGVAIGSYMEQVGGDVLISLNTTPALLTSLSGATFANPVAGNPPGVIGARVGFGASGFGRFLVMNDPRDPNFQGDLSVAGTIRGAGAIVAATSVGVGTGGAGCRLGEIIASGEFVSRAASCIRRAWVDGANGQVGVANAAGTTRALMDGTTGEISSRDAAGVVRSGFAYVGPQSVVFADNVRNTANTAGILNDGTIYGNNLRNNGNTAGIRADGTVFGDTGNFNSITINNTAIAGAACATPNSAVWGFVGTSPTWLKCQGGVWTIANGQPTSTAGAACATENQQGVTSSGVGLICSGGRWMLTADRMGNFVTTETYLVSHGTYVPKPACGSGGVAKIYLIPQAIDASKLYANFKASDAGSGWTSLVTDNAGVGAAGRAIAEVGCFY